MSELPFQGPVASVRVGKIDGELVAFPTHSELEESELDMIVSGSREEVAMIEGFAQEMPEDQMLEVRNMLTVSFVKSLICKKSFIRK